MVVDPSTYNKRNRVDETLRFRYKLVRAAEEKFRESTHIVLEFALNIYLLFLSGSDT
jgi:hypothetical protein